MTRRPRPARPRRRPRALLALLAAAALAVAGLAAVRFLPARRAPRAARPSEALPDSVRRLGWQEVYLRAAALVNAGRSGESLPLFRHALSFAAAPALVHRDYSAALYNATLEGGLRRGVACLATRSSLERVAMTLEALAELDVAERLVPTAEERALVHATRAHHLVTWGMPWDALVEFRAAELARPGRGRAVAGELARRMVHPEEEPAPRPR